jgi:hypothetical protein
MNLKLVKFITLLINAKLLIVINHSIFDKNSKIQKFKMSKNLNFVSFILLISSSPIEIKFMA